MGWRSAVVDRTIFAGAIIASRWISKLWIFLVGISGTSSLVATVTTITTVILIRILDADLVILSAALEAGAAHLCPIISRLCTASGGLFTLGTAATIAEEAQVLHGLAFGWRDGESRNNTDDEGKLHDGMLISKCGVRGIINKSINRCEHKRKREVSPKHVASCPPGNGWIDEADGQTDISQRNVIVVPVFAWPSILRPPTFASPSIAKLDASCRKCTDSYVAWPAWPTTLADIFRWREMARPSARRKSEGRMRQGQMLSHPPAPSRTKYTRCG